ncbi:50S ribosomal protein L24 [Candidatus Dependentiae bacterium]|nr:MAG: 50S ribosomal protein L24 [Candidatus Dependentiae bacterium]
MLRRIKKNDLVMVISGKDKNKQGRVIQVNTKKNKVKVKGVAILTHHVKARAQGEQGGIRKEESFIHTCKVMPICPSTDKPCRIRVKTLDDGSKVRISHRSQDVI